MPPSRKSEPRSRAHAAMAAAIQERMDEQGMNQSALASASGIDPRRLGDHVRGQHSPSTANLRKLSKALDTTVDELMNRAEELHAESEAPRSQ
jgi:transcriptional regulator with XRE-family HTH domain